MKALFIFTFLGLLAACDSTDYFSGPVSMELRKQIRDQKQTVIDLKEIVPFEWEELYLFSPYTPCSEICKQLGIPDSECKDVISSESMDDGEMYMIFLRNGEIVHKEMHIRFNGDFTPLDFRQPLNPDKAVFTVKNDGVSARGEPWLRLRLRSDK